jgi:hypothetical protein
MRHAVLGAVCAITASAVFGFGCSSSPPAASSFTHVYTTVIAPNCTNVYCHNNGVSLKFGGLDLSSQVIAYWSLVDHILEGPSCANIILQRRVVPFHPETSIMYQKVSQTNPPCGVQMPADPAQLWPSGKTPQAVVFSGTALTSDQQQLIYDWIKEGAQNN